MELIYCFIGMFIVCLVMGIIFGINALISIYKDNLKRADRYIGWSKGFIYCEFYFLALGIAAKFFV